ncbi:MAG: hypothetical protein ACOCRO_04810 [Halanaerobiales bacterium]
METYTKINGIVFFYDTEEIKMSDSLKEYLKQFDKEHSYSIYIDKSQGLVVY